MLVAACMLLLACGDAPAHTSSDAGRSPAGATAWVASVPTPGAEPYHITPASGAVWFTELKGNRVGRIATGGAIVEYVLPHPGSQPHGIAAASDGSLWVAESSGSRIARIGPGG